MCPSASSYVRPATNTGACSQLAQTSPPCAWHEPLNWKPLRMIGASGSNCIPCKSLPECLPGPLYVGGRGLQEGRPCGRPSCLAEPAWLADQLIVVNCTDRSFSTTGSEKLSCGPWVQNVVGVACV